MPKSASGLFWFAVTALITVVVGLAVYNRIAGRVPFLSTIVGGKQAA